MYNVKVLKYPSGWQYRVYNTITGYHGYDKKPIDDSKLQEVYFWNEKIQDYEIYICDPNKMWVNIFDGNYERAPTLIQEPDKERSAKVSMSRTVNRVYHLARSNVWDWFFTLTFDPVKVNSFDYDACTKKLKGWLDGIRRVSPDLRYLIVPEKHESGRFHFHGLFAGCENISFEESGHYTQSGETIYNIGEYQLGFSTATRVKDNSKVVKYISKYITKDLCAVSYGKKRYWASRNLVDIQGEELILNYEMLCKLKEKLDSECLHRKKVGNDDMNVIYYEMEVQGK